MREQGLRKGVMGSQGVGGAAGADVDPGSMIAVDKRH